MGKAEMHVIGEIVGATGFYQPALFCRWQLVYEPINTWAVLQGLEQVGQRGGGGARGQQRKQA